jgi:hypothetical protein
VQNLDRPARGYIGDRIELIDDGGRIGKQAIDRNQRRDPGGKWPKSDKM